MEQGPRSAVLIPAYKPGSALPALTEELLERGVERIVIVDDGSGPDYRQQFAAAAAHPQVRLLRHAVNLGKGAALKTGINSILCDDPQVKTVVTADADGQHHPDDVIAVAHAGEANPGKLVMGARAFQDRGIPLRSRLGNRITRLIVQLVVGQRLHDTQTGLRAIPLRLLPSLLRATSQGYDFELDMLMACKTGAIPIVEQPIRTIYLDANQSSHFNPLLDSMRIYFVLLRFAFISLLTATVDNLVFALCVSATGSILLSQIIGRVVAVAFNYTSVRRVVFYSHQSHAQTLTRYLALVVVSGAASYGLIRLLLAYLPIGVIPAKLAAELALFIVNFLVQRDFVFAKPAGDEAGAAE